MPDHRCIAGPNCIRSQDRIGAPTEKAGTLCPPCHQRIHNAVQQLPQDWADLRKALGERAANSGQRIRSTPTPGIPISTRKEALMRAIVDMADRAAAVVSYNVNTDQPDARRRIPKGKNNKGEVVEAEPGLLVHTAASGIHPTPEQQLRLYIALVEPKIDVLAQAPAEPHIVWAKPRRCDTHQHLIGVGEAQLAAAKPQDKEAAEDALRTAYALAGHCDDCNGWGDHGQERQLTELSGLDITLELVELHNQTRAELGLTRLRHHYEMPCPDCGHRVYRNDGESIVQCEGDSRHTCTEREYKVRAGLRLEERTWTDMQKYLLAEAYWRLDRLQTLADILIEDPNIDLPGAGTLILQHITEILSAGAEINGKTIGHQHPKQRASGTDKRAALQRQVDEDNWTTWQQAKPYEKPKPKKPTEPRPVENPIATSSLTLLADISTTVTNGDPRCPDCNLIHRGECG